MPAPGGLVAASSAKANWGAPEIAIGSGLYARNLAAESLRATGDGHGNLHIYIYMYIHACVYICIHVYGCGPP